MSKTKVRGAGVLDIRERETPETFIEIGRKEVWIWPFLVTRITKWSVSSLLSPATQI